MKREKIILFDILSDDMKADLRWSAKDEYDMRVTIGNHRYISANARIERFISRPLTGTHNEWL